MVRSCTALLLRFYTLRFYTLARGVRSKEIERKGFHFAAHWGLCPRAKGGRSPGEHAPAAPGRPINDVD